MSFHNESYRLLADNQSIIKAGIKIYEAPEVMGVYLWPLIFLFTLIVVAIKSEHPGYVFFYAVLGNIVLASYLPIKTNPIFWGIMVFSLLIVLWSFWASKKIE